MWICHTQSPIVLRVNVNMSYTITNSLMCQCEYVIHSHPTPSMLAQERHALIPTQHHFHTEAADTPRLVQSWWTLHSHTMLYKHSISLLVKSKRLLKTFTYLNLPSTTIARLSWQSVLASDMQTHMWTKQTQNSHVWLLRHEPWPPARRHRSIQWQLTSIWPCRLTKPAVYFHLVHSYPLTLLHASCPTPSPSSLNIASCFMPHTSTLFT